MGLKTLNILFKRIVNLLKWDKSLSFSVNLDEKELTIFTSSILCGCVLFDLFEFCKEHDLRFFVGTYYNFERERNLPCIRVKSIYLVEL